MWNPARTLAGRLILVMFAAIVVSHVAAFALFANERGRSLQRIAESNAIERVSATADRLRSAEPARRAAIAESASDFATRFTLLDQAPALNGATGGDGARIARGISEQLGGADVQARMRITDLEWPRRVRVWRDASGTRFVEERGGPPPGPPPEGGPDERGSERPRVDGSDPGPDRPEGGDRFMFGNGEGPPKEMRRVTQVQVIIPIAENSWLQAIVLLPAPRPVSATIWFAMFGTMLLVGLAALLIARQIGQPLSELAKAADQLGVGDTHVQAPESGPDDVRRTTRAFNAMAARLSRQLSRQRQMLWALSHDLRTPITALRLRAELLEDDAARQRILAPVDEMEALTEQALSLARAGASEETREEVDLAEIARTLCAELEDIGIAARADAPTPVIVACRPSEIARALRNLAENAAKYGGGGVMQVSRCANGEAIVEVRDQGPGVAPGLLARVTEPFFRADAARTQGDDKPNGAGLGLAITQAIADGHGGRLELANLSPRGFSAKLILPG